MRVIGWSALEGHVDVAAGDVGEGVRTSPNVSTRQGFVYVAFVIDAFARRNVGWRVSSSGAE